MLVSKRFLRDFAYIANLYDWNTEDVEEAKALTRADPGPMVWYWTTLAAAHRAGYKQDASNGYMRLGHWCQLNGVRIPKSLSTPRERSPPWWFERDESLT